MNPLVFAALTEIYDLNRPRLDTVNYLVRYGIDPNAVAGFVGSPTVLPISLLPNRKFDLPDHGAENVEAMVIEAIADDGETVIDLVAWPTDTPRDIHTLVGATAIVGLWQAHNPASYIFGRPLFIHRTALAWLQADCTGCAITIPKLAARLLTDLQGPFMGCDTGHVAGLRRMVRAPAARVGFQVAP